jgi:hypothetical protein
MRWTAAGSSIQGMASDHQTAAGRQDGVSDVTDRLGVVEATRVSILATMGMAAACRPARLGPASTSEGSATIDSATASNSAAREKARCLDSEAGP